MNNCLICGKTFIGGLCNNPADQFKCPSCRQKGADIKTPDPKKARESVDRNNRKRAERKLLEARLAISKKSQKEQEATQARLENAQEEKQKRTLEEFIKRRAEERKRQEEEARERERQEKIRAQELKLQKLTHLFSGLRNIIPDYTQRDAQIKIASMVQSAIEEEKDTACRGWRWNWQNVCLPNSFGTFKK